MRIVPDCSPKKTKIYHVNASELLDAWRKGNDAGDGYSVGEGWMTQAQASEDQGYLHQGVLDPTGNVVATWYDRVIVICDANGPWAVDVTDELDSRKRR